MAIVRIKDKSGLIAQCLMWANGRENYWQVFLWGNIECFKENTKELSKNCYGTHQACPQLMDPESGKILPTPKMGEIHFIKDHWDLEAVAHELDHAQFQRLRCLCPSYKAIIEQDEMDKEEVITYEFGRWVSEIYNWLWHVNPTNKYLPARRKG